MAGGLARWDARLSGRRARVEPRLPSRFEQGGGAALVDHDQVGGIEVIDEESLVRPTARVADDQPRATTEPDSPRPGLERRSFDRPAAPPPFARPTPREPALESHASPEAHPREPTNAPTPTSPITRPSVPVAQVSEARFEPSSPPEQSERDDAFVDEARSVRSVARDLAELEAVVAGMRQERAPAPVQHSTPAGDPASSRIDAHTAPSERPPADRTAATQPEPRQVRVSIGTLIVQATGASPRQSTSRRTSDRDRAQAEFRRFVARRDRGRP